MINPVIIKGNNHGIRLIISDDAAMNDIKRELNRKLQDTKHYYLKQKPIDITFEGKILTEDEKDEILYLLTKKGLNINNIKNNNQINKNEDKCFTNLQSDKDGLFYIGNLKNGQSINAATSIVIVGNIEQGACVISKGNIIVIGRICGYAKAGANGNQNAFVYNVIN